MAGADSLEADALFATVIRALYLLLTVDTVIPWIAEADFAFAVTVLLTFGVARRLLVACLSSEARFAVAVSTKTATLPGTPFGTRDLLRAVLAFETDVAHALSVEAEAVVSAIP